MLSWQAFQFYERGMRDKDGKDAESYSIHYGLGIKFVWLQSNF